MAEDPYLSSDEECVVELLPLNKRTYGSFDHTSTRTDLASAVEGQINDMIKSVVATAVAELQAECRFESELSRTTVKSWKLQILKLKIFHY